jgi:lactate dehydrogenase-like 2-hydroxyacid dehydrogenase
LGRIGAAIAQRGLGFSMLIRYHNRHPRADVTYGYEASLLDLAAWSDFLVVAAVGGASTHHLVNRKVLQALGPTGIIVNVARGPVVDENALLTALQSGELGGAALDVFEHEPQVPDVLCARDDVVLSPHLGSASYETRLAMDNLVLDNLSAYFATGQVITQVK